MATKLLKEVWWILTEGWVLAFGRWADDLTTRLNMYQPANKLKATPVSGDALAYYRKEWRKFVEDSNL